MVGYNTMGSSGSMWLTGLLGLITWLLLIIFLALASLWLWRSLKNKK